MAGRAPVGEPSQRERASALWRDVLASVNQAEKVLPGGSPSAALRGQAGPTLATIRREASDAARDRTMLDRLEEARHAKARLSNADIDPTLERPYIYGSAGAGRYAESFRDYGIDLERLDPVEAASKIPPPGPIRRDLVAALDDWSRINPASGISGRLLAIADDADDDAARKRIREAIVRKDRPESAPDRRRPRGRLLPPDRPPAGLRRGDPPGHQRLGPGRPAGPGPAPRDFWLNNLAGIYFLYSDPPRPVRALPRSRPRWRRGRGPTSRSPISA